jgi:hypothetical protein
LETAKNGLEYTTGWFVQVNQFGEIVGYSVAMAAGADKLVKRDRTVRHIGESTNYRLEKPKSTPHRSILSLEYADE